MRTVAFLLGGMILIGVGVGLVIGGMPGRWVIGPSLVVIGLACKAVGLLLTDGPGGGTRRGDRPVVTLGGEMVGRPRAGIPAGRAPLRTANAARTAVPVWPRIDPAAVEHRRRTS